MHEIHHLVEAALYVDDLDRAEAFYRDILGLELLGKEIGRHVFFKVGEGVLLLFFAKETLKGERLPSMIQTTLRAGVSGSDLVHSFFPVADQHVTVDSTSSPTSVSTNSRLPSPSRLAEKTGNLEYG